MSAQTGGKTYITRRFWRNPNFFLSSSLFRKNIRSQKQPRLICRGESFSYEPNFSINPSLIYVLCLWLVNGWFFFSCSEIRAQHSAGYAWTVYDNFILSFYLRKFHEIFLQEIQLFRNLCMGVAQIKLATTRYYDHDLWNA